MECNDVNKRIVIDIGVILLIIFGIGIGIKVWQNSQVSDIPTNQEFLDVIMRDRPALVYKEQPVIQVTNVTKPAEGWYIVTIQSIHARKDDIPTRVVILDREGFKKIVLGPEVDFPDYVTNAVTIPDSVIIGLRKS